MTGSGSQQSEFDYDIIVVGGAMVGGTLAYALAQSGYRVALLDARKLDCSDKVSGKSQAGTDQPGKNKSDKSNPDKNQGQAASVDLRTTAVAPVASTILDAFGIWSGMEECSTAITSIQVSQQGHFGVTRLEAAELGLAALGHVVDNDSFTRNLYRLLIDAPNLEIIAPVVVTGVKSESDFATVTAATTPDPATPESATNCVSSYTTKLVIAADGGNSVVRTMSGIGVLETDYSQTAIVAAVRTEQSNEGTAFERFTSSGPLALLPIGAHWNSLVFTTDTSKHDVLLCLSDGDFLKQVQQRFGYRLGCFLECGSRAAFPIVLREAAIQHEGRVLLMGNAVRALHPVAGQGFNLAIRDTGKLVELLRQLKHGPDATHPDPGSSDLLKRFVAERTQDQSRTVWLTDSLAKTFRGHSRWFSHLRAVGLIGLDTFSPLRVPFARGAMGHQASLPDLPYSCQD